MSQFEHDGNIPLGKQTDYVSTYSPQLLFPIPRSESRSSLGLNTGDLPFRGEDIWTGYELSWLDDNGKPIVAVAEFRFACDSDNIVESKSFKLYLNSFNQTRFSTTDAVKQALIKDLSAASGKAVEVDIFSLHEATTMGVGEFNAVLLDDLPVEITHYEPQPELLTVTEDVVSETLLSHLLKTNCPVTGQPDWATVFFEYTGPKIEHEGLLKYIISFRDHQDFHEHCVEQLFTQILNRCKPASLTVYARYTRRGGLDINPYRSTELSRAPSLKSQLRLSRQ